MSILMPSPGRASGRIGADKLPVINAPRRFRLNGGGRAAVEHQPIDDHAEDVQSSVHCQAGLRDGRRSLIPIFRTDCCLTRRIGVRGGPGCV
jgi:hypothetical protein